MDNRASSLFVLVPRCKDSSGLGEFALACCAMLILFCTVANAQTAAGQFNGHVYDPSGAAAAVSPPLLASVPAPCWWTITQRRRGAPPGIQRT